MKLTKKSKIAILFSIILIALASLWLNYHFKDLEKARKIKEESDAKIKANLYVNSLVSAEIETERKAIDRPDNDPIHFPKDNVLADYVAVKEGVDVRGDYPSLKSKAEYHLNYGENIMVFDTLNFIAIKNDSQVIISKNWVRIAEGSTGDFFMKGYLPASAIGFGVFKKISPNNIYDFEYLYINNKEVSIDEESRFKSFEEESRCETLKKHLRLELVDLEKYKSRKITNPYAIDTSNNYKYRRTKRYPKLNTFYVKIKDGKDSIKMKDSKGEYNTYTDYIGEIPFFNFHVIQYSCLESDYLFLDKYSGKKIDFSAGFPFISPDKKHILAVSTSYENGEDYWRIYKINEKLKTKEVVSVSFKNWGFDGDPESAFWISNNEIILKVCADKYLDKITYEYIKLTIL